MAHSTRRALLGAVAASASIGAVLFRPFTATAKSADRPDHDVVSAAERFIESERAHLAADFAQDDAHDAYRASAPPIPEEMIRNPKRDILAGFHGFVGSLLADGRWWYGAPDDLAYLREPRMRQDWGQPRLEDDGVICAMILDPVGQARAGEILAAHDWWVAEQERLKTASGYTAAKQRCCEAEESLYYAADALVSSTPQTLRGVLAKARAGRAIFDDDDPYPDVDAGDTASRIAYSIVRDLLRLADDGKVA